MERVLKKISQAVYAIFGDVLNVSEKNICEKIEKNGNIKCNDTIKDCLYSMLGNNLWRLLNKTFVYEFHQYREKIGLLADKNSTKAYDKYVGNLNDKVVSEWFEKYPVLYDMVKNSIENTCAYIERVLDDFYEDIQMLKGVYKISEKAILNEMIPMDSDSHNNGSVVLLAIFSDGKKILYKARNLGIDILIQKIYDEIISFEDEKKFVPVPKCINKGRYGWVEYIENNMIADDDISEAFYNLGLYTPIFSCLASTDMHDENIVFDGVKPYFIDLETTIQPVSYYKEGVLLNEMQKALSSSIANTSIIPAKILGNTFNYLVGAINTPYPQETSELVFNYKNVGTDAIDIAKEKIVIDRIANPIKLKSGKAIDPVPFMKYFLEGYKKGYREIIKNKKDITAILELFNENIRIVLRPTTQYFLILDACLYPEYLEGYDKVAKILSYLKPVKSVVDEDEAKRLLEEECKSLLRGDIPYFRINGNEKRLRINEYTSKDVYDFSPVENALSSVNNISENTLLFDERMIAEGFSEIKIKNSTSTGKKYNSVSDLYMKLWDALKKFDLERIYEFFGELAITVFEDDCYKSAWFGGVYGGLPISYNSISLISLHDAGGIPVFLKDLAYIMKDDKSKKLFEQSLCGMLTLKREIFGDKRYGTISIISGESSLDMILGSEKNKNIEIEKYIWNNMNSPVGDIYNGKMGLYHLLASYDHTDVEIMKIADAELEELINKDFEKFGIAHGKLGLLWAKFRVNLFLIKKNECLNIYRKLKKLSEQNLEIKNGWCNGYAGILMLQVEMSAALGIEDDFYDIAKKITQIDENEMIDLSICHGAAGIIQTLVFSYSVLGEKKYLELAEKYWNDVCRIATNNGFYTGEENRDYLLGYFLGWSGIIDSILLIDMYKSCQESYKKPWIPLNLSSFNYQNNLTIRRKN